MSNATIVILMLLLLLAFPTTATDPLDVVKLSSKANISIIHISGLDGSAAKAIAALNPAIGSGHYVYFYDFLGRQNLTQAGQSRALDTWRLGGIPPLGSVKG